MLLGLPTATKDGMEAMQGRDKIRRDASFDGIRFVAILLVMFIHVSSRGFLKHDENWAAVNFYESLSRVSVPLFLMVTGALLLPKSYTVGSILNRVWRVALPLVAWSLLYLTWDKYVSEIEHTNWLATILYTPVAGHLWYLYTLIGAYLFLPVMAGFHQTQSSKVQGFVLIVSFIGTSVLPMIHALTGNWFVGINFSFFSIYATYIMAGAAVCWKVKASKSAAWACAAVWLITTLVTISLTSMYFDVLSPKDIFYEYYSPVVFIGTIAAFVSLRSFFAEIVQNRPSIETALFRIGRVSFGIYLVHPMVIWLFEMTGCGYAFMNSWVAIPVVVAGVFIVSAAVVLILQRLPVVRLIVPS